MHLSRLIIPYFKHVPQRLAAHPNAAKYINITASTSMETSSAFLSYPYSCSWPVFHTPKFVSEMSNYSLSIILLTQKCIIFYNITYLYDLTIFYSRLGDNVSVVAEGLYCSASLILGGLEMNMVSLVNSGAASALRTHIIIIQAWPAHIVNNQIYINQNCGLC